MIKQKALYGIMSLSGTVIIPPVYENVEFFDSGGNALAKRNGKFGFINTKNVASLPIIYDEIEYYNQEYEGIYKIKKGKKYALFDRKKMTFISRFVYDEIGWIGYNDQNILCAHYRIGEKTGYLNKYGKEHTAFSMYFKFLNEEE